MTFPVEMNILNENSSQIWLSYSRATSFLAIEAPARYIFCFADVLGREYALHSGYAFQTANVPGVRQKLLRTGVIMADIIIIAILVVVVFFILKAQIGRRRRGGCSGGCAGCSGCAGCHSGCAASGRPEKKEG